MFGKLFTPASDGKFELPIGTYYIARTVRLFRRCFLSMSRLETRRMRRRPDWVGEVDRPVWITGMARAGTTISLEILSQHPDVATHRYFHIPNPYLPYWWDRFIQFLPLPDDKPVERIHLDRIMVTKDSPEALEEPLWKAYFKHIHNEKRSNILDAETSHKRFEKYFRDHLAKLVVGQGRSRYVAKNNYNVARLEYLLKLFPDARFLIYVRDPLYHLGSYMKQNRIFMEMAPQNKRLYKMTEIMGHQEFGPNRKFINVGNNDTIRTIREHDTAGEMVKGFATYWASVYNYVANRLESNPDLRRATQIVRYEDLVTHSGDILDRIVEHTGLDADAFRPVRDKYVEELRPPSYYKAGFTDDEVDDIRKITGEAAARFGYGDGAESSWEDRLGDQQTSSATAAT